MMFKKKRYYREWLATWGYGIMLAYDTIMAESKYEASKHKPVGMYGADKSFETIVRVKKKHLHLNDIQLSKLYGEKEEI